jgi:hypothetical protein
LGFAFRLPLYALPPSGSTPRAPGRLMLWGWPLLHIAFRLKGSSFPQKLLA